MKPTPHDHSCDVCSCVWSCMNAHCEDFEVHWCRNFCLVCGDPPAAVRQARALLDTAEELLHAAHTAEHNGGDSDLARDIRMIRQRVQFKAGRLQVSVRDPKDREPRTPGVVGPNGDPSNRRDPGVVDEE